MEGLGSNQNNDDTNNLYDIQVSDPYGIEGEKNQILGEIDKAMADLKSGKSTDITMILMLILFQMSQIGGKVMGSDNQSLASMGKLQSVFSKYENLVRDPGGEGGKTAASSIVEIDPKTHKPVTVPDIDPKTGKQKIDPKTGKGLRKPKMIPNPANEVNDYNPFTGEETGKKVSKETAAEHLLEYMKNTVNTPYLQNNDGSIKMKDGKREINPIYVFFQKQKKLSQDGQGNIGAGIISSIDSLVGACDRPADHNIDSRNSGNTYVTNSYEKAETSGKPGYRFDKNGNLIPGSGASVHIPDNAFRNIWDVSKPYSNSDGTYVDPNNEPLKGLEGQIGSVSQEFTSASGSVTAILKTDTQTQTAEIGTLSTYAKNIANILKSYVSNQKTN